ncbi:glycoside hydrolase family 25 protein [Mucilaginibacter sp. 44-25]|uniref:glycoside hydrolase family 25 protein n=1 Tax=Mucilaginibacter sp. 44-25 TaxID=1895794 RepID=UPI000964A07A|nr:glycoside hydrolase family 25 protein [Mucilaginibacter sp. 44-25]OJW16938.1 MAG: glycoside hydrolase [Mucilaginibacter sp. 44-25]
MPVPKKKTTTTARRKPTGRKKKLQSQYPYLRWYLITLGFAVLFSPFYYGYVFKTFSSAWRWIEDIGTPASGRIYKSFGISIPEGYSVHGIDVSYAQGKIDWQKVRHMHEDSVRISFAYIKATEGLLKVDPYFKRNWREAAKVGIKCGAYHFFRPKKNGLWQARFFLQNVEIENGDLPPVVDIERLDGKLPAAMRKELKEFIRHVESKTGVKPIIYTGISFYNDYLRGFFDGYPLWIAHYDQPKLNLQKGTDWKFWQHSERSHVNGIAHTVDFDVFKGDSTDLERITISRYSNR